MWVKSSYSDNGHCVRVTPGATSVWIGDSTHDPRGVVPVLSVDRASWREFVGWVCGNEKG